MTSSILKILQHNYKLRQSEEKIDEIKSCPKIIKTKTDVGNSVPPASISEERNALRRRQEEDSVTCIRRQRAATQSDDDPGKRANDTCELLIQGSLFHRDYLDGNFLKLCIFESGSVFCRMMAHI